MNLPDLEHLKDRLKWARERKNLSQTELGFMLHLSQGAIEKAENGKTRKPKYLPEAADILEVPYSWLAHNQAVISHPDIRKKSEYPVYGYASGQNQVTALNEGAIIEYIPNYNPHLGNDGFYMIVVGDSMEPRYEQGERIAVSRSIPPRKGRDCVIEFTDGTAAIKRYISKTDDRITCEQLNPQKTVIYNLSDIKAIYAVVGREG